MCTQPGTLAGTPASSAPRETAVRVQPSCSGRYELKWISLTVARGSQDARAAQGARRPQGARAAYGARGSQGTQAARGARAARGRRPERHRGQSARPAQAVKWPGSASKSPPDAPPAW
ncbi:hypothetical protein GCM10010466_48730 [Planomonospora alba]|uniref:Uncharacterized protein n=1 Tax=Planomonospora alba TaxID=161354 RepID=A0ABP6NLM6_9ACTN